MDVLAVLSTRALGEKNGQLTYGTRVLEDR